ncbi:MAG: hypothetical protein NW205_13485 [Hyphomicrobiaceae bacterium]|nr:hypothetical protein [Hyphomicrobiaceae bacterium]
MTKTVRAIRFHTAAALAAVMASGLGLTPPPVSAAAENLEVDWSDPEIAKFLRERTTRPPQSVSAEDQAALSRLRLPVIAFDRPPGVVGRAFGVEAAPKLQRELVTDPDNPVWYTIVDRYGDLVITVDADLRIQRDLPADTKIYTPPPSAAAEPQIDVIDANVEEGMEGLVAEYSVRKFPDIPYRVTIECTTATKQLCTDKAALLRDREALQIISARPPQ